MPRCRCRSHEMNGHTVTLTRIRPHARSPQPGKRRQQRGVNFDDAAPKARPMSSGPSSSIHTASTISGRLAARASGERGRRALRDRPPRRRPRSRCARSRPGRVPGRPLARGNADDLDLPSVHLVRSAPAGCAASGHEDRDPEGVGHLRRREQACAARDRRRRWSPGTFGNQSSTRASMRPAHP